MSCAVFRPVGNWFNQDSSLENLVVVVLICRLFLLENYCCTDTVNILPSLKYCTVIPPLKKIVRSGITFFSRNRR